MARESCRELAIFPSEATFGMHGAQNLPRIAARERTVVKSCHGKALGDASRESIAAASQAKSASVRSPATVGRWETHFASILSSASPGTHRASILPLPVARERIREDLAMDERLDSPRTK